jgi:hypothetical protein
MTYDMMTGVFTIGPSADPSILAGAVDSVNGDYYFSSSAGTTLNVYDPTTNTASVVGPETGGTSADGDLVFDKQGNGYFLGDQNLFRFSPTANATGKVVFTELANTFSHGANGIAFGGDGFLYTTNHSTPGQIIQADPVTGEIISTRGDTGPDGLATNVDAASWGVQPGTVSLKKNLPSGRAAAGD